MKVLEFIDRRFKKDCDWVNGNCYYFALILKDRFPEGKIYYDVILGHFVFQYNNQYYDWTGILSPDALCCPIEWGRFDEYDSLRKDRVVRDCVM